MMTLNNPATTCSQPPLHRRNLTRRPQPPLPLPLNRRQPDLMTISYFDILLADLDNNITPSSSSNIVSLSLLRSSSLIFYYQI